MGGKGTLRPGMGQTLIDASPRDLGGWSQSVEPGCEERLDLAATAGAFQFRADGLALDDDECRHHIDAEPVDEVRPLLLGDAVETERLVVSSPLQNLGEESFDAPTGARHAGVEEDESRLRCWTRSRGRCSHGLPPYRCGPFSLR